MIELVFSIPSPLRRVAATVGLLGALLSLLGCAGVVFIWLRFARLRSIIKSSMLCYCLANIGVSLAWVTTQSIRQAGNYPICRILGPVQIYFQLCALLWLCNYSTELLLHYSSGVTHVLFGFTSGKSPWWLILCFNVQAWLTPALLMIYPIVTEQIHAGALSCWFDSTTGAGVALGTSYSALTMLCMIYSILCLLLVPIGYRRSLENRGEYSDEERLLVEKLRWRMIGLSVVLMLSYIPVIPLVIFNSLRNPPAFLFLPVWLYSAFSIPVVGFLVTLIVFLRGPVWRYVISDVQWTTGYLLPCVGGRQSLWKDVRDVRPVSIFRLAFCCGAFGRLYAATRTRDRLDLQVDWESSPSPTSGPMPTPTAREGSSKTLAEGMEGTHSMYHSQSVNAPGSVGTNGFPLSDEDEEDLMALLERHV